MWKSEYIQINSHIGSREEKKIKNPAKKEVQILP